MAVTPLGLLRSCFGMRPRPAAEAAGPQPARSVSVADPTAARRPAQAPGRFSRFKDWVLRTCEKVTCCGFARRPGASPPPQMWTADLWSLEPDPASASAEQSAAPDSAERSRAQLPSENLPSATHAASLTQDATDSAPTEPFPSLDSPHELTATVISDIEDFSDIQDEGDVMPSASPELLSDALAAFHQRPFAEGLRLPLSEVSTLSKAHADPAVTKLTLTDPRALKSLGRFSNLQQLTLEGPAFTHGFDLADLPSSVKSLTFKGCTVDRDFFAPPSGPRPLASLSLINCTVRDLTSVARLEGVDALKVSGSRIGDKDAKVLSTMKGLKALDLSDNVIHEEGAAALSGMEGLDSLNLSFNDLGDNGAKRLSTMKGLKTLNLSANAIFATGASALSTMEGLTTLDLTWNYIGDKGAIALSENMKGVTSLNLWRNNIGDAGAIAVSKMQGLAELNLGCNYIHDEGAVALSTMKGLTSLDLRINLIGDAGAIALSKMHDVRMLDLGANTDIGAAGSAALASMKGTLFRKRFTST